MDGVLIVDKPKGLSSHDVVDFIRKKFHIKKVGHAGTLDPQATGVLVILIGKFTKRSQEFSGHDKEYQACLTLGIATDSLDAEGRVLKREEIGEIKPEAIERVFSRFLGGIEQVPPMFSALKRRGKKLYQLARRGIEVERKARQVYIYELEMTKLALPRIYFAVSCSKGTYIRSLCADIAGQLGCPGHLAELRRTRSGQFSISQAISLDRLKNRSPQDIDEVLVR